MNQIKRIFSLLMSMVLVITSSISVFAGTSMDTALNKVNLYVKQDKGGQLLTWKGVIDAENFAPAIIVYRTADGQELPAFCANPNKPGVEDLAAKAYDVDVDQLDTDPHVWAVITNGYPYKTPAELGLKTDYEAYYATKMAVWAIVHDNYSNLDDWKANGEQNAAVEKAMKDLVAKGRANSYVYTAWLATNPVTTTAKDTGEFLVQEFNIKSNVNVESFRVVLDGDVPAGTKVADENGQEKDKFDGSTTKIKVMIPKAGEKREGTFRIILKATLENKAVMFGQSHENKQDYYVAPLQSYNGDSWADVSYLEEPGTPPDPEKPDNPDPPTASKGLQILKVRKGTTQPLAGAVFKIAKTNGGVLGHYVTDAKGEISIPDIPIGEYYIEEEVPPLGHVLDENSHKDVVVTADEPTIVTFSNEEMAELEVLKVDADTGEQLAGAAIRIALDGGHDSFDVYTNASGRATLTNLKSGTYTITEISAPDGYILNETPQSIKLEAGKSATITLKNKAKPGLVVKKYDEETGMPLPDAEFSIAKKGGSIIYEGMTDKEGKIKLDGLDEGWYTITELAPPSGYLIATESKDVYLEPNKAVEVKFDNRLRPSLQIMKIDAQTGEALKGAKFKVTKTEDMTVSEYVTDGTGTVVIHDMDEAVYTVEEIQAPEGYRIDPDSHKDIALEWGKTKTLVFSDTKNPVLEIQKIDSQTKEPLAGAKFRITKTEDKTVSEHVTKEDGKIVLENLSEGLYTIEEIEAPDGYRLDPEIHKDIALEAGKTKTLVFSNTKNPVLEIQKIDSQTKKPLAGAKFKVTRTEDNTVSEYLTDADGKIVIKNLAEGIYTVEELTTPTGYILDVQHKEIELEAGKVKTLIYENTKKPTLILTKTNVLTEKPVPNTVFKIQRETENGGITTLGTYKTDKNGQIILKNVEPGWYIITETRAAQGMSLPSNPVTRKYLTPGENAYSDDFKDAETTAPKNANGGGAPDHTLPSGEVIVTSGNDYKIGEEIPNYPLNSIVIKKVDANTSELLAGAAFEVRQVAGDISGGSGTIIGRYTTDNSGIIVITGLEAGAYVVEEVQPPRNYLLSENSKQQAWLKADGTSVLELTFVNYPYGSILVTKVDAKTNKPLSNARFKVTTGDGTAAGNSNGEFVTNSNGEILVPNLKPGSYVITELEAPEGYALDTTPQTIEIGTDGGTYKVSFQNQPESALVIIKKDSSNKAPLSGAKFKVTTAKGDAVGTGNGIYTTDGNGTITIPGLGKGSYVIEEIKAPEGYVLENQAKTIAIDYGKVYTEEFLNQPMASLIIHKFDSKDKKPLSGAEFTISRKNGEVVGKYTTNSSGIIQIDELEPGWYSAVETKAPNGYLLNDVAQDFEIKHTKTVTLEFANELLTVLVIKKIDAKTGEPLSGAKFEIERQNGEHVGEYTSGSDGVVNVSQLAPGWYIIKESKAPAGYLLDETPKTVEVKTQTPTVVTFKNQLLAALQIKKVDAVTGAPLAGAKFKVMKQNGEVIGEYTTEKDGFVNVPELAPGYYSISEMKAPEGYILDESPKTVEVKTNKPTSVVFENKPLAGIKIIKTDSESGEPLEGVMFSISKLNGEKIGTFKTDKEGMLYVSNLEDGYYTITEIEGLEGYHWDQSPATVEVKSGKLTIHEVKNEPYSLLVIKKTSSRNGEPIEGVEFLITKENGEKIGYYETDSSGRIEVEGLEDGVYLVKKIKAAKGFQLDSKAREVEIRDGKRAVVKIENDPLSSVLIRKIDSVTGKGIEGVTFLLYNEDNEPIGQFVSDNEGYVWIRKELPEGKYKLRELEAADGYLSDEEVKTFYVQNGRTTEIIWENTPEVGQIVVTKRSSEFNELTGLPAGSPLAGAVFEVYNTTGNLVDKMTSDSRGIAASKGLSIGVYTLKEVSSPRYYALNDRTLMAEIRHNGDIVRFELLNGSVSLNLTVQKKGPNQSSPGQTINYEIYGVTNESTGKLEDFYIHDRILTDATRVVKVTTGTYSERMYYKIEYKTNYRDYMTLADNLLTKNDYEYSLHPNALGLQNGEYVTDVRLVFPQASPGFRQTKSMHVLCQVLPSVPKDYNITNRADVGGRYGNEWESAKTSWNTTVWAAETPAVKLPKMGY